MLNSNKYITGFLLYVYHYTIYEAMPFANQNRDIYDSRNIGNNKILQKPKTQHHNHHYCCLAYRYIQSRSKISTMSATTKSGFDQFIKTIGTFQSMKDGLDEDYYTDLEEIVDNAMKQVSDRTGKYLHNVWNLGDKKPDEDTLQKMIDNVPSSLSYQNEDGEIPMFSVLSEGSVQYLPLLAKEGVKHNVGGDDARGGLLLGLLGDYNVLNILACIGDSTLTDDPVYLDVMKQLRKSKLLLREDIHDYDLLYLACLNTLLTGALKD